MTEVEGIECPFCSSQIWSRYRHDFRYCPCGYCFIDGGRDYTRVGWGLESRDVTAQIGEPKGVKILVNLKEIT